MWVQLVKEVGHNPVAVIHVVHDVGGNTIGFIAQLQLSDVM